MRFTETRFFRFFATGMAFAIFNLAAPQGVVSMMAPDPNAPQPAPEIKKTPKRTRLLTAKVMRTTQGRVGGNPYLAGQNKWDVLYKGVNLMSGNYSFSATDISYEGGYGIPVNVTRSYSSNGADEGPMGYGWNLSVDVRSTAGGILKSAGAPVRSVPTSFKERPSGDNDPRVMDANEPVAAVIATDAGGTEETIQKDVDGVLTTPPWDKNIIDSEYEFVTVGSNVYQVVKKNIVKTLDGTIYQYTKHGSYPLGMTARSGGASGEPSNVLKIDKAIDRHGNETLYSYATTSPVTFSKTNGSVTEERLVDIKMPNGHHIGFEWTGNRITKAKDLSHSGTTVLREWTYGYTGGKLTSATSPGGKVTTYGYGDAIDMVEFGGPSGTGPTPSTGLLTSITDPRGLTTTIHYVMGRIGALPTGAIVDAPVAYRVTQPNGVRTYIHVGGALLPPSDSPWTPYTPPPTKTVFCDRVGSPSGALINAGAIGVRVFTTAGGVPVIDVKLGDNTTVNVISPGTDDPGDHQLSRRYHYFTQDLLWERKSIFPKPDLLALDLPDLAAQRRAVAPGWNLQRVETTKEYNFMGNPLETSVVESSRNAATNAWTIASAKTASYAYWGADKYFQQKAVRSKKDALSYRYSFNDYYDVNATQGMKGQTKAIYDAKHATYSLGSNWKYDIQPVSGSYPVAEFPVATGSDPAAYDLKGRSIRVRKLSKVVSGTPTYVETRTTYGADTDGSWGQASQVTEANGTPLARNSYTLSYTPDGRANQMQDASGRIFQTNYGLDGEVNWIKRVDSGLSQILASYVYGTTGILNGQVTAMSDGLSGITQSLSYVVSGGGLGQVGQVTQTGGSLPNYTITYAYNPAGERAEAAYDTPNGTTKWGYGDYIRAGDPISGGRSFQTLRKLDSFTSAGTTEEFHYAYDSAGRLANVMFGQTPQSGAGSPTNAPFYTQNYPAQQRYQACYEMDPVGRTLGVYHRWDQWSGSSYSGTPVLANECQFEAVKGLKTQSQTLISNSGGTGWMVEGTETYFYEAERNLLTSADYDGSGPGAPETWSYDVSQNRNNSGYTYDALNQMTTSPSLTYTYDSVGNRLTKGTTTVYGWDALNRMTSLAQTSQPIATYVYRADGTRVAKTVGTVSTLYRHDGQMPIQEVESNAGSVVSVMDMVLGVRGVEAISRTTGLGTEIRYPLYDAHGSSVGTVTRSGPASLGNRRSYDAWGGIRGGAMTGMPHGRYVANLGHEQDDESGLVYMRSRYYEPASGRFISEDSARDGLNWFSYAEGNPVCNIDQSGNSAVPISLVGPFVMDYFRIMAMIAGATSLPKRLALARLSEISIEIETEFGSRIMTTQIQMEIDAAESFERGDIRGAELAGDMAAGFGIAGKAMFWSLRSQLAAARLLVLLDGAGHG